MSSYERRSTSAVKSILNSILSIILIVAAAAFAIGVAFLIIKDQEKRETIETFHLATVEYKKESEHYYIYVKTEEDELIELQVHGHWKDINIGDTVVYKKTEEYINENNERKLLKTTYEY